jgi:MerR family transcriptional regulator, light-induced transcriptional regulator
MTAQEGFSIQFVTQVTGINAHTLRAWEKRYNAVVPTRNIKGKRLYSQEDIERLKKLIFLVNMGSSISDVASLNPSKLEELVKHYESKKAPLRKTETSSVAITAAEINSTLQHLVMALHGYKLDIISHELDKIKNLLGPRDFALSILSPLLSEVGNLVENGSLSIAQEHSLSAILKFHVGHMLFKHLEQSDKMNLKVVISAPEGELHEFGIMISALLCCHYNLDFFYLGPNMPAKSLAEAANQIGAKKLIIGVSRVYDTKPGGFLDSYVNELIHDLNDGIDLWVGGVGKATTYLDQPHITLIPTLSMLDHILSKTIK